MPATSIVFRSARLTDARASRFGGTEASLGAFIEGFFGASDWVVRIGPPDVRLSSIIARAGAALPRVSFTARRSLSRGARPDSLVFRAAALIGVERQCMMRLVWRDKSTSGRLADEGPRIAATIARLAGHAHDAASAARDDGMLRRALDRLDLGFTVATCTGRVVFANRAARRLPGFLERCGEVADRRLRLPRSVVDSLPQSAPGGSTVLSPAATSAKHPVFVNRLDEEGEDHQGLLVIVPTWSGPTDEKPLAAVFGLTPAEAKVALAIARGNSVQDAATVLSLREDSVRTYLKRIFLKLGVARQNELAALVTRTSAPLDSPCSSEERAGSATVEFPRAACCGVANPARALPVVRRA